MGCDWTAEQDLLDDVVQDGETCSSRFVLSHVYVLSGRTLMNFLCCQRRKKVTNMATVSGSGLSLQEAHRSSHSVSVAWQEAGKPQGRKTDGADAQADVLCGDPVANWDVKDVPEATPKVSLPRGGCREESCLPESYVGTL